MTPISASAQAAVERVHRDFPTTISRLQDLVRIPSCSFPGFDHAHLAVAAEASADWLQCCGFPEVRTVDSAGPGPYVVARDHRAGADRPTVLLYAHHDVQPPMREELWTTPAYQPTVREGRLYGRGTADDKAGIAAIAAACGACLADGPLPVNVTVLIDGEEEIGSPNLGAFLDQHLDELRADLVVIADLVNVQVGLPSLTIALRGMLAWDITVTGQRQPLHSGMWSGPLPDPTAALLRIIDRCSDAEGRVAIPDLPPPQVGSQALEDLQRVPYDAAEFHRQAGLPEAARDLVADGPAVLRRIWYEPALTVTAVHAGGQPGQAGNVICDRAWARLSLRLAPGQDPERSAAAVENHLRRQLPAGVDLVLQREASAPSWTADTTHPVYATARAAFAAGYGVEPVAVGCGGTIPFVPDLTSRLGDIPALLIPVEDPDSRAHAEDESVDLGDLARTSASLAILLHGLAEAHGSPGPGSSGNQEPR